MLIALKNFFVFMVGSVQMVLMSCENGEGLSRYI